MFLIFSCFSQFNGQSHYKQIVRGIGHKEFVFKGVNNAFLCKSTQCEMIVKFKINFNESFNFYDRLLPIDFFIQNADKIKVEAPGYFPQSGHLIEGPQIPTSYCQSIKRFINFIVVL